jgi:hypothetical protein
MEVKHVDRQTLTLLYAFTLYKECDSSVTNCSCGLIEAVRIEDEITERGRNN